MTIRSSWKTGNFKKSILKMQKANRAEVRVGIVKPMTHSRPGRSPISMAQLYAWHDTGTNDGVVPARPTLIPTFNEYEPLLLQFADNLIGKVFDPRGNLSHVYNDIGKTFSKLVRHKIMNLSYPPLKPYTIKNRINKGTTNPLVDTGQLMNAISYSVKY